MSMELVQPEITRVTMTISLNVLKSTTMKPQVFMTFNINLFESYTDFGLLELLD